MALLLSGLFVLLIVIASIMNGAGKRFHLPLKP
jgi:hypothetical protein